MHIKCKAGLRNGSALLVALGITLVLSIALASYLSLTLNERSLATRSADWNTAIPVAEAGVEEALTELYYYGTNNLATNSYWSLGGDGMYHKSRTLPSGTYYTAIQLGTYPTIWSTGRVSAPFGGTNAGSTNAIVKRLIKVTTYKASASGYGIISAGTITFQGGSVVNAYNSANGPYSAATVISNAATIITDSTANPAVTVQGGSTLSGSITTGPGGVVSNGGTVSGTIAHNANVQINANYPPSWSSNTALFSIVMTNGTLNGTNYNILVSNTNYVWTSLGLGGGSNNGTTMAVNGVVNIYLTQTGGNQVLDVGGSGFIYIAPGATLNIYTAGGVTLSGSGIVNPNANTSACSIIGTTTCTQVTLSGSSNFYGLINAPAAAFQFTGGGTMQAFGGFIVGSATVSGTLHFNINSGSSGYLAQSWNELPAP